MCQIRPGWAINPSAIKLSRLKWVHLTPLHLHVTGWCEKTNHFMTPKWQRITWLHENCHFRKNQIEKTVMNLYAENIELEGKVLLLVEKRAVLEQRIKRLNNQLAGKDKIIAKQKSYLSQYMECSSMLRWVVWTWTLFNLAHLTTRTKTDAKVKHCCFVLSRHGSLRRL